MSAFIQKGTPVAIETTNGGRCVGTLTSDYSATYPVFFTHADGHAVTLPGFRVRDVRPLNPTPASKASPDLTLTLQIDGPHQGDWRLTIHTTAARTFCGGDYWACADYVPHKQVGALADRANRSGLYVRCE
jgi:hypothetical protein